MAYEPTQWQDGDTITTVRLNKMEQGIADGGNGAFVVDAYYYEEENNEPSEQ